VVLEESVEVISFGGSVQKRVLSGFGVEKDAHGIELTEIQSENFHSTCVLWVWGWSFVTFLRCKRRTRSRVRVARFYSKGSHPKPRTYMHSFWLAEPRALITRSRPPGGRHPNNSMPMMGLAKTHPSCRSGVSFKQRVWREPADAKRSCLARDAADFVL
jgi:hypothetical protein